MNNQSIVFRAFDFHIYAMLSFSGVTIVYFLLRFRFRFRVNVFVEAAANLSIVLRCAIAGTFNTPTSYHLWVWKIEADINWSMVTYQGSTRLELP